MRLSRLASIAGARAVGAVALGALSIGALAIGAVAIGRLALGRVAVGHARLRRLEIDELVVRDLQVTGRLQSPREEARSSPKALCAVACVFTVADVERSLDYYRDKLGFTVKFTYDNPTSYAGMQRDDVEVFLEAAADTQRHAGHGSVYVFVADVDALYAELTARGARTLKAPQDYDYGMRDFDVQDLDGNRLCFGMETKKALPAAG